VIGCALVAVKRGRRLLTGLDEDLHLESCVWCGCGCVRRCALMRRGELGKEDDNCGMEEGWKKVVGRA
jgi:hypothetical protein